MHGTRHLLVIAAKLTRQSMLSPCGLLHQLPCNHKGRCAGTTLQCQQVSAVPAGVAAMLCSIRGTAGRPGQEASSQGCIRVVQCQQGDTSS